MMDSGVEAADALLLYLRAGRPYSDARVVPYLITYPGIVKTLGLGFNAVAQALERLEKQRYIYTRRVRTQYQLEPMTAHYLTPEGIARIDYLRDILRNRRWQLDGESLGYADVKRRLGFAPPLWSLMLYQSSEDLRAAVKAARGFERVPLYLHCHWEAQEMVRLEEGVEAFYDSPTHQIMVIHGPEGMGKTNTVLNAAALFEDSANIFYHSFLMQHGLGVFYSRFATFLRRIGKPGLAAMLRWQGLTPGDFVSVAEHALWDTPTLIILDDVHHVPEIADVLRGFLTSLERIIGVRIIVSGRTVPEFYSRKDVEVFNRGMEVVPRAHEDASLGPGVVYHHILADALGMETRSFGELLERLPQHLNGGERALLWQLSIHRKPVEITFILENHPEEALTGLVEKRVVHLTRNWTCAALHPALRELEVPSEEKLRAHSLAVDYYMSRREHHEALYHAVCARDWKRVRRVLEGIDPVSTMVPEECLTCIGHVPEDVVMGDMLLSKTVGVLLCRVGKHSEAAGYLMNAAKLALNMEDYQARALCLYYLGRCMAEDRDHAAAIRAYANAIDSLYRDPMVPSLHIELYRAKLELGERDSRLLEDAVRSAEETGNHRARGTALMLLAKERSRAGKHDEALELLKRAVISLRRAKDTALVSQAYMEMGRLRIRTSDASRGFSEMSQAYNISREYLLPRERAAYALIIGEEYLRAGRPQDAMRYLEDARWTLEIAGTPMDNAMVDMYEAWAQKLMGNTSSAKRMASRALSTIRECGTDEDVARAEEVYKNIL